MIQASDLRLGNWITGELGNEMTVCLIYKNTIECDFNGGWCSVFCPTPIPLSPEILEKCGFERQDNNWERLELCNDWSYLYWERLAGLELSVSKHSIMLPHIKYLHQLQNLYFALTGEELTYKP